jgi:hypothetical protein
MRQTRPLTEGKINRSGEEINRWSELGPDNGGKLNPEASRGGPRGE